MSYFHNADLTMCLQVYTIIYFNLQKVIWKTIRTCPCCCCWLRPGCSSPRSSAWWGSSSRGPRGWDGWYSARPHACSAACLNTKHDKIHTIHTLTRPHTHSPIPMIFKKSFWRILHASKWIMSPLKFVQAADSFWPSVHSSVMCLTSDAHVDVFVLVEVVVFELVHVVLGHADVVMIWSWGDAICY